MSWQLTYHVAEVASDDVGPVLRRAVGESCFTLTEAKVKAMGMTGSWVIVEERVVASSPDLGAA